MTYIFDVLEFQVLAAARGMESYYGFPPETRRGKEDIFFAVYQMTHDEILKKDEAGLVIQPPISGYMDTICQSPDVLVIDRGNYHLPRQCVYTGLSDICVCVENSPVNMEKICLSGMTHEEFLLQLMDLGQIPEPHLKEDIGEYDFYEYWITHTPETLHQMLMRGIFVETEELLEHEMIHSVFSKRNKSSGEIQDRMILIDYPLELCMVIQDCKGGVHAERYDRNNAMAILDTWWRNAG